MEKLTLFQKLLEIQKAIIGLGKDGKSFGYQYVTGSKALEHIKPLMNKYGLILKQEVISITNTRQDYQTKNGLKSEILTTTTQRFTWVDSETGEKDENLFAANGQNDWEKGLGSALTYAERYFLLKYFHIATDEDDIDNPERDANKSKPVELPKKVETPITEIALKVADIKTLDELTTYYNTIQIKTEAITKLFSERKKAINGSTN